MSINVVFDWLIKSGVPISAVWFTGTVSLTFVAGVCARRKLSAVNWKRSDYLYFSATIAGAIIGIAEFSNSSLNKELQSDLMEKANITGQLIRAAQIFDARCTLYNQDLQKAAEEKRLRDQGILLPPERYETTDTSNDDITSPLFLLTPSARLTLTFIHNRTSKCEDTHAIAIAVTSDSFDSTVNYIAKKKIYIDEYFKLQQKAKSLDVYAVLVLHTVLEDEFSIVFQLSALLSNQLDKQLRSINVSLASPALATVALFRRLYPFLLGFGLGIRLARTHYDVMTEKEKAPVIVTVERPHDQAPKTLADASSPETPVA